MFLKSKVLVLIIPFIDDGGVERLVANMTNYLDNSNLEVDVYVYSIRKGNGLGKAFFEKDHFISFFELLKLCFKKRKKIVLFSALTPANFFATFLCIFFQLKFYPSHNCVVFKKSKFKWFLIKLIYNFINFFAYRFIATSHGALINLQEILFNSNKVVNYYNPVLEKLYRPFVYKEINFVVKFCVLGRLSYQKGFDVIIKAFAKIKNKNINNFQLFIAGNGEELIFLKNLVKELHLESEVHFVGFTNDLKLFYEDKDYFLFPSRYEGLGLSLIEAMNFGLPVISSDCLSGPSEILLGGELGMLIKDFENPDIWANKISNILTSLPLNIDVKYQNSLNRFLISEYLFKILE